MRAETKCRTVIRSATEPGDANLRVDPIELLPSDTILNTKPDDMLDGLMTLVDFNPPFSNAMGKIQLI